MLFTLMYHRAFPFLEDHLKYIKKYPVLLPGEPIKGKSICLTFDDATSDFYKEVFPILQKLSLRVILAVPVAYISTEGYCSWEELKEMVQSGYVHIASHSYSHPNLLANGVDLKFEIIYSKYILQNHLGIQVNTFVYPYGKFNAPIHSLVKKNYSFIMRIGGSFNLTWQNFSKIIYRIDVDGAPSVKRKIQITPQLFSFLFHSIRQR